MKVMKFGGRSIGTPEKMQQVLSIITSNEESAIVILSAVGGTSQLLRDLAEALHNNRRNQARTSVKKIEAFYKDYINIVLKTSEAKIKALSAIQEHFTFLQFVVKLSYSEALSKDILSHGELISTLLLSACLHEAGIAHEPLPAFDFMQTDKFGEPLIGSIKVKLTQLLAGHEDKKIFVTQGTLCRNGKGEIDNLGNGGSDYTASSVAAAMGASVCEIWTDLPAMHNNDPAAIDGSKPVDKLSFDEAAELAYFSEKVLHPASLWPARHYGIPVRLLNTQQPQAEGTWIVNVVENKGARVIAARDSITVINVKSSRMLMAYGFLQKIVEVFEKYHTSIDMVTTSEVAVSVTIDNAEQLPQIVKDLEAYGVVTTEENQTIVTIVGNEMLSVPGILKRLFTALDGIPLQMVSYGGSRHNVSLLMSVAHKKQALTALHLVLTESLN